MAPCVFSLEIKISGKHFQGGLQREFSKFSNLQNELKRDTLPEEGESAVIAAVFPSSSPTSLSTVLSSTSGVTGSHPAPSAGRCPALPCKGGGNRPSILSPLPLPDRAAIRLHHICILVYDRRFICIPVDALRLALFGPLSLSLSPRARASAIACVLARVLALTSASRVFARCTAGDSARSR